MQNWLATVNNYKNNIINYKNNIINKFNFNINYCYCGFPLFNLDFIKLPETLTGIQTFLISILTLCIILLWCFINIVGYLGSMYIIKYTQLEEKYPKYKKIINYFVKSNYVFIIIEIILFTFVLLSLIGLCIYLLTLSII